MKKGLARSALGSAGHGLAHLDDVGQILLPGRGVEDRLGRILQHGMHAVDIHRVGRHVTGQAHRRDEVDLRAGIGHACGVDHVLQHRCAGLPGDQIERGDQVRAHAEVRVAPCELHRLLALAVVDRDRRRRALDARPHQRFRDQRDVAVLDATAGVLQELQPFLVEDANTDGLEDLHGGVVQILDLFLGQQPVAGPDERDGVSFVNLRCIVADRRHE